MSTLHRRISTFVLLLVVLSFTLGYKKDGKCYKSLNLAIIIDASGSIEPSDWNAEIQLAKEIVQKNTITGSGNRFAIMDFSTDATLRFNLDADASKALIALDTLKENFKDGHSVIDGALNEAVRLFEANPAGKDSVNAIVLITDGYMTFRDGKDNKEFLKIPKEKLSSAQVVTFSVGVGESPKRATLQYIASEPAATHLFRVTEAAKLKDEIQKATETNCGDTNEKGELKCGSIVLKKAGLGCYKDNKNPPPLPDLILTERDTTSPVYNGQTIDWAGWDSYMPALICRCAEKTKSRKRVVFGLQKYGECWSSEKQDTYAKDGVAAADGCKTFGFKDCTSTDLQCVGQNNANFVYKIEE